MSPRRPLQPRLPFAQPIRGGKSGQFDESVAPATCCRSRCAPHLVVATWWWRCDRKLSFGDERRVAEEKRGPWDGGPVDSRRLELARQAVAGDDHVALSGRGFAGGVGP